MWSFRLKYLSLSVKLGDSRKQSGGLSRSHLLWLSVVFAGEMNGCRTMKQPPGGDCHDLFGAEFKGSPCHHRVLKPPGGGSSDIFGASEVVEQSPRRGHTNHLQSSVFGTNGTTETPTTRRSKPGGNPVTGEGYIATAANDEKGSTSPPAATTTSGAGSADIRRNRVPPGGYSSGLW